MSILTEIPIANGLKFYKKIQGDDELPSRDKSAFIDTIGWYQKDIAYYQKIQTNERLTLQIHVQENPDATFDIYANYNTAYPPLLKLLDDYGNVILDLNTDYLVKVGANVGKAFDGNEDADGNLLMTILWTGSWADILSDAGVSEGYYHLYLKNQYDNTTYEEYLSEPLWIKEIHDGTIYLSYSNNSDKNNLIVTPYTNQPKFGIRIEGEIRGYKPDGSISSFQDQNFEQQNLEAIAWDTDTLLIGGYEGVPEYMLQKLNEIFTFDNIRINKRKYKYYNKGTSSNNQINWAINSATEYPSLTASLPIILVDRSDAFTFSSRKIRILTNPGTYPFAIEPFALYEGATKVVTDALKVFEADTDVPTWVTYMNNTVIPDNDLDGQFVKDDDDNVDYVMGDNESFTSHALEVFDKVLTIPITTSAINADFSPKILGRCVADFDDNLQIYQNLSTITAIPHTYAAIGNYSVRIFTVELGIDKLYLIKPTTGTYALVTDMPTGTIARGLGEFYMDGYDLSAHVSVDASFLNDAAEFLLSSVSIINCNVKAFSPHLFANSGTRWNNLIGIGLWGNELTSGEVDNIINDVASAFTIGGGILWIYGQSPAAPPTGASASAQSLLTYAGWTVSTD